MALCTHPGMKSFFLPIGTNGLITSREVNEARGGFIFAAGRVRSKKKKKIEKKKHGKKIRPTRNTPRNPQQAVDRVQLETACEETRLTR